MNEVLVPEVVIETKLVKVAGDAGLEQSAAGPLVAAFAPVFMKAKTAISNAAGVAESVRDATCVSEIKKSRECRLAIRAIRIEGDKIRKAQKANALTYGRAVDGLYNLMLVDLDPLEKSLQDAEDTAERAETARKDALEAGRKAALAPYVLDVALYAVRDMAEPVFAAMLAGVKLAKEQAEAAAAKAEADRIAKEKAEAAERERIRAENEKLRQDAIARETAAKIERERIAREAAEREAREIAAEKERQRIAAKERAEREAERQKHEAELRAAEQKRIAEQRAAEEKARKDREAAEVKHKAEQQEAWEKAEAIRKATEAKAKAEREAVEAKARADKAAADAVAKKEREAREKIERELAAKKAAEDADRKRAELAAKKAAAAPDKEKLLAYAAALCGVPLPKMATKDGELRLRDADKIVQQAKDQIIRAAMSIGDLL